MRVGAIYFATGTTSRFSGQRTVSRIVVNGAWTRGSYFYRNAMNTGGNRCSYCPNLRRSNGTEGRVSCWRGSTGARHLVVRGGCSFIDPSPNTAPPHVATSFCWAFHPRFYARVPATYDSYQANGLGVYVVANDLLCNQSLQSLPHGSVPRANKASLG